MNIRHFICVCLCLTATTYGASGRAQEKQPEYVFGPGDIVRIQVYQNPDLNLETRVTENGSITFPLIGHVKIGGMTIAAGEQTIAAALKAGGFVKQPQVIVLPTQIRSNQISVLGQVGHPGRYPLETFNTRLSEIIAIAGGISETGAEIAIVTGTRDGKPFRKEIDISAIFLENKLQDDLILASGDVIYVQRMSVFYIYGEVQKPGSYRVERGMTIRQALAQGGGPTVRGTERRLSLFRRSGKGEIDKSPNLSNLVWPDDVLFVGESLF